MSKDPPQPTQNRSPSHGDFERFDSMTRKLFTVPKAEIDKLEVKYQKKKAAKKKKPKE